MAGRSRRASAARRLLISEDDGAVRCGRLGGFSPRPHRGLVPGYRGLRSGMEFRTKILEALRNDAEDAADAIDEAQQQLNVLYKSIRDAHADGHSVPELEQATGLHP